MPAIGNYRGIIPAIACPFTADHRIDEARAAQARVVARRSRRRRRGDDQRPYGRGLLAHAGGARDGHAHRGRRAARPLAGHLVDRLRGSRRRRRARAHGRARRGPSRSTSCRRTIGCASAARRVTRSSTSTRSTRRRLASTSSVTSIRRGRARRTRHNCWPISRACPTSRRSRSDSAT